MDTRGLPPTNRYSVPRHVEDALETPWAQDPFVVCPQGMGLGAKLALAAFGGLALGVAGFVLWGLGAMPPEGLSAEEQRELTEAGIAWASPCDKAKVPAHVTDESSFEVVKTSHGIWYAEDAFRLTKLMLQGWRFWEEPIVRPDLEPAAPEPRA